jgi:CHAT domain-containing protein
LPACRKEDTASLEKGRSPQTVTAGPDAGLPEAWEIASAEVSRYPDSPSRQYKLAVVQERLGLTKSAIATFDTVVRMNDGDWSREARERRETLMRIPMPPVLEFDRFVTALRVGDHTALRQFARAFPSEMQSYFTTHDANPLLADVLAENGDPFARDLLAAGYRVIDPPSASDGPLKLLSDYNAGVALYTTGDYSALIAKLKPVLEAATEARYHALRYSTIVWLAEAHNLRGEYTQAVKYFEPLATDPNPSYRAAVGRRILTYQILGSDDFAWRDALRAIHLAPHIADLRARHIVFGSTATLLRLRGHPALALLYQEAAVDDIKRTVALTAAASLPDTKHQYAVALRARAALELELGRDADAALDLDLAKRVLNSAQLPADSYAEARSEIDEVDAQLLVNTNPAEAVKAFTSAIDTAKKGNPTRLFLLHLKRSAAYRVAGDFAREQKDIATALAVLKNEQETLLGARKRGEFEEFSTPYFSRFQSHYHTQIEKQIARGEGEAALISAEQARAFEPMYLALHSRTPPAGFHKIESLRTLKDAYASLPDDTFILEYLVLDNRTYAWLISRQGVELFQLRATRANIERWVRELDQAVKSKLPQTFESRLRAPYEGLFAAALGRIRHPNPRFVIVPDGPMHALPFIALKDDDNQYLIKKGPVSLAGSASLYFYAVARDRELPRNPNGRVLVVGDPAFSTEDFPDLDRLPRAREEPRSLIEWYGSAVMPLIGAEATVPAFLSRAKQSSIVHFAGHAKTDTAAPSQSMLVLAPSGADHGRLTAERLLANFDTLENTRLFVLAACSTADGQSIGPEGLSPLVRPLVAANVPGVVGTLWKVGDATAHGLFVSFHRHYRDGADMAAALRDAQLEMLQNESAMVWAPFQAVGFATSPYGPTPAEEKQIEHLYPENSLHRPDGLRPQ